MFRATFTACVSPAGNQPIHNVLALKPRFHVSCGDYFYNDSQAVYTINGYTMNPTIFWDYVVTPNGAPVNAHSAAYMLTRYEKHFGRTFQLGTSTDNPTGVRNIKNVVVGVADSSVSVSTGAGDISSIPVVS